MRPHRLRGSQNQETRGNPEQTERNPLRIQIWSQHKAASFSLPSQDAPIRYRCAKLAEGKYCNKSLPHEWSGRGDLNARPPAPKAVVGLGQKQPVFKYLRFYEMAPAC
jgi:hypothetical protein